MIDASALPTFWRRCLPELHRRYDGLCPYLALWIPPATGGRTVDHFIAKSNDPFLAYEWSNYRLASALMNTRKGRFDDVLDPFEIEDGWFALDLSGLQVVPIQGVDVETAARVRATIERLRLNDSECREARGGYLDEFLAGHLDQSFLYRRSPLVAREIERQGIRPVESAFS